MTEALESYKKKFPFRVGCPSYIYPADILPNVIRLAPCMDEIEIILFESSSPENLPADKVIEELNDIAQKESVAYTVHLPLDCFIGSDSEEERRYGIETFGRFIQRSARLGPRNYIVHFDAKGKTEQGIEKWKYAVAEGMESIVRVSGIPCESFAVEMLDYPFEEVEDIIMSLELSVCFEIGHLLKHDLDILDSFNRFRDHISVIHMHGCKSGKDHMPLDVLGEDDLSKIREMLEEFSGTLIIEVFSFEYLERSLACIERLLHE